MAKKGEIRNQRSDINERSAYFLFFVIFFLMGGKVAAVVLTGVFGVSVDPGDRIVVVCIFIVGVLHRVPGSCEPHANDERMA